MKEIFINNISDAGIFIGIMFATAIIAYLFNRFFRKIINVSTTELKIDPTNYQFLRHFITAVIYVIGIGFAVSSIPDLRSLANKLLAGAGILAVAIGFASQQAFSNIIGGVFIIIFKPFRVNDRVKLREMTGIIEDISLRHTVIRDFKNRRIIIPNSVISEEIIINSHFGDEKICKWVDIGISYDSNLLKAKNIIRDEIVKHPLFIDARTPLQMQEGVDMAPVRVIGLNDSSIDLRGCAWALDASDAYILGCELMESIKLRFDREGIEIPFPHRTIVYKNHYDKSNAL